MVVRKSVNKTDPNDARTPAFLLSKDVLPEKQLKPTRESRNAWLTHTRFAARLGLKLGRNAWPEASLLHAFVMVELQSAFNPRSGRLPRGNQRCRTRT